MDRLDNDQLSSILTLDDFEELARSYLSEMAYAYLAGGGGAGLTVLENRAAFNRIRLIPRFLVDVSSIDTRFELFGETHEFPILLAPTAYHKLVHPEGELETIRGANMAEATLVTSLFSSFVVESIAAIAQRPLWLQMYVVTDRVFTKELIDRAVAAGCKAICITVDTPLIGPRDRELRAGFHLPAGIERANLAKLGNAVTGGAQRPSGRNIYLATHAPDVTWKDVDWLRSITPVKLLLKGILHPTDAELAVKAGCDGLIVSNHGGRSLDTVLPTIEALPAIVERTHGEVPLLLDGGIRRGIDVFKALALGATAVLIGRPYIYGLATGGAQGVSRVVEILRTELEMTMGLTGCPSLAKISKDFLAA